MGGSIVWCIETKTLTRILGWFEAIGSGLGIVGTLGYLMYYGTELDSDSQKTLVILSYKLRKSNHVGAIIFHSAMLLTVLLIILSAAVFLLVGTYKRKPNMISFWTTVTTGVLIGVTKGIITLVRMDRTDSETWYWFMFVYHALWICIAFSLFVVHTHKKDIKLNLLNQTHSHDTI